MKVKFWGVRGSLPAPLAPSALESRLRELLVGFCESGQGRDGIDRFLSELPPHRFGGFGGNTPCIEVITETSKVIIDGGTGLRPLGYELMSGPCGRGAGEIHLVFTHFHWDHLIGLPFFVPLFIPGNRIHVYAVQPELEEVFRTLFRTPFFPVPFEALGARIEFHRLEPRAPRRFGDLTATPYQLDHPDPCWGFRFEHERNGVRKAFAHCVDTECTRVTREQLGPDLPLYQNADLMVFDAQYTLMETVEKVNWGHATAPIGLDIALRENVKRVLFMHHDPASNDERIMTAQNQARRYYQTQLKRLETERELSRAVDWEFAREGMVVEV